MLPGRDAACLPVQADRSCQTGGHRWLAVPERSDSKSSEAADHGATASRRNAGQVLPAADRPLQDRMAQGCGTGRTDADPEHQRVTVRGVRVTGRLVVRQAPGPAAVPAAPVTATAIAVPAHHPPRGAVRLPATGSRAAPAPGSPAIGEELTEHAQHRACRRRPEPRSPVPAPGLSAGPTKARTTVIASIASGTTTAGLRSCRQSRASAW